MAILLRRQLNDAEKQQILTRFGRRCFSNGHDIPESETVQFDHITAWALDGLTELNNIAPMCATHNREKGTLPLADFRVRLQLREFFASGDKLTLKHLLNYLEARKEIPGFGEPVSVKPEDSRVRLISAAREGEYVLYTCPITSWKYFYATLPVELIDSDDDTDEKIGLQPRYLIEDKVFGLFRHFQTHPVLQPSIGRIVDDHVRLFDGQHKLAALLWNNRREFECKIYVTSDVRLLNQTNISAHDNFAQTRFFASVMVTKLGNQFGKDFDDFKSAEEPQQKTEEAFLEYLSRLDGGTLTRGEINRRFRAYLYTSCLEDPDNKLKDLVSDSNRSTDKKPITMDMLEKSLFSNFMYRVPTTDNMVTEAYRRDQERDNMVFFMNALHEAGIGQWNPNKGPNDTWQRHLERLLRSKCIMAWSELVHDAVCGKLDLQDSGDRERPLYRDLVTSDKERLRRVVERLMHWSGWDAPANSEIDRILSDRTSAVKDWLKLHGLTAGYLMGASE